MLLVMMTSMLIMMIMPDDDDHHHHDDDHDDDDDDHHAHFSSVESHRRRPSCFGCHPSSVVPVFPLSTPVLNDGGVMLVLVLVRRHATLIAGVCEGHGLILASHRHRRHTRPLAPRSAPPGFINASQTSRNSNSYEQEEQPSPSPPSAAAAVGSSPPLPS